MEKVWLEHYPTGIPKEISESSLTTVTQIIEDSLKKYAHLPAYSCMGKTLSYKEIDELSQSFGAYLTQKLGLKKGAKVALMMPNLLAYPICLHGALRSGLTVVNVNPLYTPRELEHQLNDGEVEAIVILENFAHVLQKVIDKVQIKHIITTTIGDFQAPIKKLLINSVVKYIKKMVPPFTLSSVIPLTDLVAQGKSLSFTPAQVSLDDIAFLQYTGGTTGVSKGAILTHKNISANITQASAWLQSYLTEGKETVITALPLYHIFSLTANCMVFFKIGGHNILVTNPKDIKGFIKILRAQPFTVITGVNTLFNALMNNSELSTVDFSALRLSLGGGMAVQRDVAERWKKQTKVALVEAYGLTETSPAACINPLDLKDYNGTVGLPLPSTSVKVIDEEGKELGIDEPGELCIKGPQVTSGYWKREEETKKSFLEDGWFRTGDIAVISHTGYVKIVDRLKDMILVSGFNVYPNELEDVLAKHEGILEAAAVGVPSEKSGEEVKVFVVKKDDKLTKEDVLAHCKKYLTGYKVPRQVEFKEELPKTNVGKILRRALKETK